MRLLKNNNPKICQECNESLPNSRALSLHLRRRRARGFCPPVRIPVILKPSINKHKQGEYICIHCKKTYKQEYGLRLHGRRYLNGSCKLKFPNLYRTQEEGGIKKYFCNNCDAEYTIYSSIQNHIQQFRKKGVCPVHDPSRHTGVVDNNKKCQYCGHEFDTRNGMLTHMYKHDPITGCAPISTPSLRTSYIDMIVTEKNTVIYKCKNCKEIYYKYASIYSHLRNMVDGKCSEVKFLPGEELQPFVESRIKCRYPFWVNAPFQEEPQQLGSTEHIAALDRMSKWIAAYKQEQDRISAKHFHGVYCVAVLGEQFKQGQNIREFIKTNPSQVLGTYWGSCSKSYMPVSTRHKYDPETSVLAKAAMSGYTIAVLGHVEVEEHHEDRSERIKRLEAMFIAATMTDAEFVPVAGRPQYPLLNQKQETHQLLDLKDLNLKKMYKKGIKGIIQFCLEENCDGRCTALLHPDWESNIIYDLKTDIEKKHPNIILDPFIPKAEKKNKRQRPNTEIEFQKELSRKIKEIKDYSDEYDRSHYLYTVIVVPSDKFPRNWGARKICTSLIERKHEDITVGVYVGVNSSPKPAEYHTNEYKHHSSIDKAVEKGGIPIVININKFETKQEAREQEATFIAYNSILQRWKVDGIKFELLNEKQEWKNMPVLSPVFKERIGDALSGRQYVSFTGEGVIDLNAQMRRGKIYKMEF